MGPTMQSVLRWDVLLLLLLNCFVFCLTEHFNCPTCFKKCHCHCVNETNEVSCVRQNLTEIPPDLPHDVVHLDLSNNNISNLSSLINLSKLKALKLTDNRISAWNKSWLTKLPSLEELTLSQNQLKSPPDPLCGQLPALKHLHLDSNKLNGKFPDDYRHCAGLVRLTLSDNPYESIDNNTLCNLAGNSAGSTGAQPLSLKLNRLKLRNAQPGSLSCLSTRLQSLDLSQNSLSQSDLEGLIGGSKLSQLKTLNLRRSAQLRSVSAGLLHSLNSLQTLLLDYSPNITELHEDALAKTPNLSLLNLSQTQIAGWTGQTVNQLHQLAALDLSFTLVATIGGRNGSDINPLRQLADSAKFKNLRLVNAPLECDCSLYWFWERLRDNQTIRAKIVGGANGLTCAGPSSARGARLTEFNGLSDCFAGFFTKRMEIILAGCAAGLLLLVIATVVIVVVLKRRRRRQAAELDAVDEEHRPPPRLTFSGASTASSVASSVEDLHSPLVTPADRRARRTSIWIRLRRFLRERRESRSGEAGSGQPPIYNPPAPEEYLSANDENA